MLVNLFIKAYLLLTISLPSAMNTLYGPHGRPDIQGISTIFGTANDVHQGGSLACQPGKYALEQYVCAHRYLPCGTVLILENPTNGNRSWCKVADRGPYGSIQEDGSWAVKKTAEDPGEWRGVLDISPLSARQLGHSGYQRIRAWRVKAPKSGS